MSTSASAAGAALDRTVGETLAAMGEGARVAPSDHGFDVARWSDLVGCEALRELPAWVTPVGAGCTREVAHYRQAHHLGVAWGVLAERAATMGPHGSASRARAEATRGFVEGQWRAALSRAAGDPVLADALVDQSVDAWRVAVARDAGPFEARARRGDDDPALRLRLRWASTSASAMLLAAGRYGDATTLRQAVGTLLQALAAGAGGATPTEAALRTLARRRLDAEGAALARRAARECGERFARLSVWLYGLADVAG